jgi:SGNH domain-containing protein
MASKSVVGVALALALVLGAGALARATPRCYGAASRDPGHRCVNPALRTAVIPTPAAARRATNAPCTVIQRIDVMLLCRFGIADGTQRATVALIGDSHAQHWRGALEVVAQRRRWRGLSVTHPGCPLSRATKALPEPDRTVCRRWNGDVLRWLRRRPDIHTVFVSELNGRTGVEPYGGRAGFAAQAAGYRDAWAAIPSSVRRMVVIRDTPRTVPGMLGCISRAMAARRDAGAVCAMPRRAVLPPDPAVAAARATSDRRVRVVDLTRFLCDPGRCYPVVGGALVYKDHTHLTKAFAGTLGPYLLRAVDRVL